MDHLKRKIQRRKCEDDQQTRLKKTRSMSTIFPAPFILQPPYKGKHKHIKKIKPSQRKIPGTKTVDPALDPHGIIGGDQRCGKKNGDNKSGKGSRFEIVSYIK